jgi:hypothetical protein
MSKVTMADALAAGDGVIRNEQLQECIKALEWYAERAEDLNKGGWTAGKALGQLREDRGKRAKEAIAKVRGESNE